MIFWANLVPVYDGFVISVSHVFVFSTDSHPLINYNTSHISVFVLSVCLAHVCCVL